MCFFPMAHSFLWQPSKLQLRIGRTFQDNTEMVHLDDANILDNLRRSERTVCPWKIIVFWIFLAGYMSEHLYRIYNWIQTKWNMGSVFPGLVCVCLLVAAPLNIIFRVFALWFVFPGSRNPLSLKSHLLLKLLPFFNGMAHCTSFGFWVSTGTFWKVLPKIKTGAVHRTCIKLI